MTLLPDQLTILCPITSRGCSSDRSQQPIFHALLPSMDALQMWGGVRLYLGYDFDDPIWSVGEIRSMVKQAHGWVRLGKYPGGLTAIWNAIEQNVRLWGYDYILPANDDLAFETSPLPAIDSLKARNDFGIVGFHDHAFPGLATFFVVGRTHFDIFGDLYPLPWPGAHQDSWIADVYRPWGASEIDPSIRVHNRTGSIDNPVVAPRFEYGTPENYRAVVMDGRRKVNDWLKVHPGVAEVLSEDALVEAATIIE